ncbi:MAG: endonuclease [Bacteroidales bacterium]
MRYIFIIIMSLGILYNAEASENRSFRIVFYNVENLFDLKKDSLKDDSDFLPGAGRKWNYSKYKHKQINLSKVLCAIGGWDVPALIGLCEVENDSVLKYLTRYTPLRELGYKYVVTNSPDRRGIDVALLYQPDQFRLLEVNMLPVSQGQSPTRDLLHVSGRVISGDTLDVFVCHLPSKSRGEAQSDHLRMRVVEELISRSDSISGHRANSFQIVMGDMNDHIDSKALTQLRKKLHHISHDQKEIGTYYFQNSWETIDHFFVSDNLLRADSHITVFQMKSYIFAPDFLFRENKNGIKVPWRTYQGLYYSGGYSDHLPVYLNLNIKW